MVMVIAEPEEPDLLLSYVTESHVEWSIGECGIGDTLREVGAFLRSLNHSLRECEPSRGPTCHSVETYKGYN